MEKPDPPDPHNWLLTLGLFLVLVALGWSVWRSVYVEQQLSDRFGWRHEVKTQLDRIEQAVEKGD